MSRRKQLEAEFLEKQKQKKKAEPLTQRQLSEIVEKRELIKQADDLILASQIFQHPIKKTPKPKSKTTCNSHFFKLYRYWLGIDGGSDTGVAMWDKIGKKFDWIETVAFWDLSEYLISLTDIAKQNLCVVIEDPGLNKSINAGRRNANPLIMGKIGQAVGSVKAESRLLIYLLERLNINHVVIRPTAGKKNASQFKSITKYEASTNQHERDAGLLVFGR